MAVKTETVIISSNPGSPGKWPLKQRQLLSLVNDILTIWHPLNSRHLPKDVPKGLAVFR